MSRRLNISDPVLRSQVNKMLIQIYALSLELKKSPLCKKETVDKRLARR